jgi:hypothetical protein
MKVKHGFDATKPEIISGSPDSGWASYCSQCNVMSANPYEDYWVWTSSDKGPGWVCERCQAESEAVTRKLKEDQAAKEAAVLGKPITELEANTQCFRCKTRTVNPDKDGWHRRYWDGVTAEWECDVCLDIGKNLKDALDPKSLYETDKPIGLKFDGIDGSKPKKLQYRLLPWDALDETVRVLMFGAYDVLCPDGGKGYGPGNWLLVEDAKNRYAEAAIRHIKAWWMEGKIKDPDSGLHPLGHALCCCLFLLARDLRGKI